MDQWRPVETAAMMRRQGLITRYNDRKSRRRGQRLRRGRLRTDQSCETGGQVAHHPARGGKVMSLQHFWGQSLPSSRESHHLFAPPAFAS
ncbi:MAG: hypothetical protein JXA20_18605 [Spirochaetes bacterium]|nr:hypothetical protein [Spirochaetota bacterium]